MAYLLQLFFQYINVRLHFMFQINLQIVLFSQCDSIFCISLSLFLLFMIFSKNEISKEAFRVKMSVNSLTRKEHQKPVLKLVFTTVKEI